MTTLALAWDPQIRGAVIVLTAFTILVGGVYLLLMTNTGARLGFLLAVAGLAGWIFLMAVVWMVFGIGLRGRQAAWEAVDLVAARPASTASVDAMVGFPDANGWERLDAGDAILADAQAAADAVLTPATTGQEGGHGGGTEEEPAPPEFAPPFSEPADYVLVAGYRKGGENYLPGGIEWSRGFLHRPHYVAIQVLPAIQNDPIGAQAPPVPRPDLTQQPTTVVLVRDLGSLRFPPFVVALASGTIFAVTCYVLHQRDREIMAGAGRRPASAPQAA